MTSYILTIVAAVFGSTGFWTLILKFYESKSKRNKAEQKSLEAINKSLDDIKIRQDRMESKQDLNDVKNSRIRILRFNDELLLNVQHTKEYFDNILEDVMEYENYCQSHKDFKNGKTVMAVKNIKTCYEKCMDQKDFLRE
jgi:hypothetical protein